MKCPTCGANLQIEDEKCPFCGNPNPFAVKHQQDMRQYRQEFQETKQEVEKKTLHFNFFTARIAVIAVLLMMILGMVFVINEGPHYLWARRVERDIAKNMENYRAELSACEEAGQWRRLYALYDNKSLSHTRDFQEYTVLSFVTFDYKSVLLRPQLLAALTTAAGLAWKSGVAAEVLCLPEPSLGQRIYYTKYYLDIPELFAWTAATVALSMVLERLLRACLARWGRGWGT